MPTWMSRFSTIASSSTDAFRRGNSRSARTRRVHDEGQEREREAVRLLEGALVGVAHAHHADHVDLGDGADVRAHALRDDHVLRDQAA